MAGSGEGQKHERSISKCEQKKTSLKILMGSGGKLIEGKKVDVDEHKTHLSYDDYKSGVEKEVEPGTYTASIHGWCPIAKKWEESATGVVSSGSLTSLFVGVRCSDFCSSVEECLGKDTVNHCLKSECFEYLGDGEKGAFLVDPAVKVLELSANTKLFKLTQYTDLREFLSPWWSLKLPEHGDQEGAAGRLIQAIANGLPMRDMARYMSAVTLEWNTLEYYMEIELKKKTRAFWGQFSPQKHSLGERPADDLGLHAPYGELGQLPAYQLYIPSLPKEAVKEVHTQKLVGEPSKLEVILAGYLIVDAEESLVDQLKAYITDATETGPQKRHESRKTQFWSKESSKWISPKTL